MAAYITAARSSIFTKVQDLVLEIGRDSAMVIRSPMRHSLFSSCALSLVERLKYLPYIGCFTLLSISTTTDLFILSLTTRPVNIRANFFSDIFRHLLSAAAR